MDLLNNQQNEMANIYHHHCMRVVTVGKTQKWEMKTLQQRVENAVSHQQNLMQMAEGYGLVSRARLMVWEF